MSHFREKIEQTPTFKSLDVFQRQMTLKKTNLRHIQHGVDISNAKGFDYFDTTNLQYTERNKNIVREIYLSQQQKSA